MISIQGEANTERISTSSCILKGAAVIGGIGTRTPRSTPDVVDVERVVDIVVRHPLHPGFPGFLNVPELMTTQEKLDTDRGND